ncbi:hypothetical protein [Rhodococcus sp. IEGM 1330]|uniref:hypothetical protein n=1 Tax=Rhodococcus sp. IEGM 1330 TaxID=3082225 RepID=UPI002955C8A9|nr:hypothetical protein [Rhodococcus sp. IEGM 1330]MDV8024970.1 hypothetical protein [Rhodococcus sp. IEGM 1330]
MTTQPKLNSHKRVQSRIDRKVDEEVAARLAAMPQPAAPEPATPPRGPGTNADTALADAIAAKERAEQQAATIDTIRAARATNTPTPAQQRQTEADATVAAVIEERRAKKEAAAEDGDINERRHAHVERTRNGTTPQPLTTAPTSGIAPFRQRSFEESAEKTVAAVAKREQRRTDIANTLHTLRTER